MLCLADSLHAASCRIPVTLARAIDDRQRRRRDTFRRQLALNLCPERKLAAAAIGLRPPPFRSPHLPSVLQTILQPERPRSSTGDRIQAAHAVVQRERAVNPAAGDGLRHDLRSFAGLDREWDLSTKPFIRARSEILSRNRCRRCGGR